MVFIEKYVIDEFGQVLNVIKDGEDFAIVEHGDRIIKNNSIRHLKETVKIKKQFVKVNDIALKELGDVGRYVSKTLYLVGYEDGILRFPNGVVANTSNLSKAYGTNARNAARIADILIKKDVIHVHKSGKSNYYTFNPFIACRGKVVYKELYLEFEDSVWASSGRQPTDLETYLDFKGKD